ncbi:membrane protein insertase, YidC/Oxa1 family [Thermocrinis albus DSM 14484]|uniref:Membrane protein insertase YidC n=1 Tax=Thermocrinis albus (strain DSM 14484 / JCM 11386 / HI 11/12) TaxID=638303 RepID=D3SM35_THEAH|nr:membrane protein insertase YidC [Thermocrinis albus]ADC89815.1 membrane protein insertase, YidC/Oxa1 family [Thermocrinis albus DSM 14484]
MDKKDIDTKRLFIFLLVITFALFAYQTYLLLFRPSTPPQEKPKQVQKDESVPQLMLGSFREAQKPSETLSYRLGDFSIKISPQGGKVVSWVDEKYGKDLVTSTEKKLGVYPLEIFTGDPQKDVELNFSPYQVQGSDREISMTLQGNGWFVRKRLVYDGERIKLYIEEQGLGPIWVNVGTPLEEDSFYTHVGPVLEQDGSVKRIDIKDVEGRQSIKGDIKFAGVESRYYFKGLVGNIPQVVIYRLEGDHSLVVVRYSQPLILYMGAKDYGRLRVLGLSEVLDYGTLRIIVKPLFVFMYWIYEHLHSWVFSILVLTLLVRLIVFPLTYKSTVSMMRLSELAPKMQELREKYKDDPVKFQEELMKLYAEAGFNPMSGCLPILLQIPIFFALYKVLTITAELQLASFLWIPSLAQKDPYYLLPILMGVTMIAQQWVSPAPDKSQNLMMYVTSVVFTFLFASFPSGLVLYWTFNNILNIVQSYVIKRFLLKEEPKRGKRGKKR